VLVPNSKTHQNDLSPSVLGWVLPPGQLEATVLSGWERSNSEHLGETWMFALTALL
jgi:hypothetical protein